ncbi:MAG TPA: hypothetical protein VM597_34630 [Gemmataceae bacterium]|nr:hypothetical protein [Gemmataceae bacterium]
MASLKEILERARRKQFASVGATPPGRPSHQRRASIHVTNPATMPRPDTLAALPLAEFLSGCPDDLAPPPTREEVADFLDFVAGYVRADRQKSAALGLLRGLLADGGALAFPNLSRPVLAYHLALRVLDPTRVNQKRTGLCGPAALAVEVARTRPGEYAQFALDLALTGVGSIRGRRVQPGPQIRNYRILRNAIPEGDFLVLASLRDSTLALDATTDLKNYHGVSLEQMFDWCVACGYPHVVMYMTPPEIVFRWSDLGQSAFSVLQATVFEVTRQLTVLPVTTPIVRVHPLLSAPVLYPFQTRLEVAQRMSDLLARGDKVFLLCHAHLAEAAEAFSRAIRDGLTTINGRPEREHGRLLKEWAAHGRSQAVRQLARFDAKPHWVLLDEFLISGDGVSLRLVHHGKTYSFTNLPLDGVLLQLLGFVAAGHIRHDRSPTPGKSKEAPF